MDDLAKFKDLYIKTSRNYIEDMQKSITDLLKHQTERGVETVYLSAHSLTGQSMVAGFPHIGNLASAIQDMFKEVKSGRYELNETLLRQLLAALDKMRESLERIEKNNKEIDLSTEIKKLKETYESTYH